MASCKVTNHQLQSNPRKFNEEVAKFEGAKKLAKVYQSVMTSVQRNGWTSFLVTQERHLQFRNSIFLSAAT